MRALIFAAALLPMSAGAVWAAGDVAPCTSRQSELSRKADQFTGDPMTKRLIQADLRRALKEIGEGDADECTEALDHADKLLAGQF